MTGQIAIGAATLLLAACATAPAPAPQPPADSPPQHGATPGHRCDPVNIQQFVGQQKSDAVEQNMLRVSGASTVRWVPPNTAITMEFRYDRLTVYLDSRGVIDRISCS